MTSRILTSIILLLAMFLLVPPMFKEGRAFDITAVVLNDCGKEVTTHGVLFDNVYFSIAYVIFGYLGIVVPFLANGKIHKSLSRASFLMGAWFISGLCYELANLAEPLKVYNDGSDQTTFNLFLITFILGITFIIIHDRWNKLAH